MPALLSPIHFVPQRATSWTWALLTGLYRLNMRRCMQVSMRMKIGVLSDHIGTYIVRYPVLLSMSPLNVPSVAVLLHCAMRLL